MELKQTAKLHKGYLYVAATGQPFLLQLTRTGPETSQTNPAAWSRTVAIEPPSDGVEISRLQRRGRSDRALR